MATNRSRLALADGLLRTATVQRPMIRFTEAAEAVLGEPVNAVVPLMYRHRASLVAGIVADAAMAVLLGAIGVHDFPQWALSGAVAGVSVTALTRQLLLVLASSTLWLIAARPFRSRPDVLVGEVDRSEVTTTGGKFNDVLRIGETRYVLPRLFREQANAVLAGPAEPDDTTSLG